MRERSAPEKAEIQVAEASAPLRHTVPIRALGAISERADQPQLISICLGVLVAGIAAGDRQLARAGARTLAAELLATERTLQSDRLIPVTCRQPPGASRAMSSLRDASASPRDCVGWHQVPGFSVSVAPREPACCRNSAVAASISCRDEVTVP